MVDRESGREHEGETEREQGEEQARGEGGAWLNVQGLGFGVCG